MQPAPRLCIAFAAPSSPIHQLIIAAVFEWRVRGVGTVGRVR